MTTTKLMNETGCHTCLFRDNCPSASDRGCQNYAPDDDDYELEEYIEAKREEFDEDWFQYIAEWD